MNSTSIILTPKGCYDLKVIGVNCYTESEPSPLANGLDGVDSVLKVDPAVEAELASEVAAWRMNRDAGTVRSTLDELRRAAEDESANIMPATIALAHAGGTTGEWADVLREVSGSTGLRQALQVEWAGDPRHSSPRCRRAPARWRPTVGLRGFSSRSQVWTGTRTAQSR